MVFCKPTVLFLLFPMQTNQTHLATTPHMSVANPGQWVYNPMVCIILCESHACTLCAEWAHYYTYFTLDSKVSLSYAEAQ